MKMPTQVRGRPQEIERGNSSSSSPHPNGGGSRPCSGMGDRMPTQVRGGQVTHTDLNVMQAKDDQRGDVDTSRRMPKQMRGQRQTIPRRR